MVPRTPLGLKFPGAVGLWACTPHMKNPGGAGRRGHSFVSLSSKLGGDAELNDPAKPILVDEDDVAIIEPLEFAVAGTTQVTTFELDLEFRRNNLYALTSDNVEPETRTLENVR